jgi:hypothetical protein
MQLSSRPVSERVGCRIFSVPTPAASTSIVGEVEASRVAGNELCHDRADDGD